MEIFIILVLIQIIIHFIFFKGVLLLFSSSTFKTLFCKSIFFGTNSLLILNLIEFFLRQLSLLISSYFYYYKNSLKSNTIEKYAFGDKKRTRI